MLTNSNLTVTDKLNILIVQERSFYNSASPLCMNRQVHSSIWPSEQSYIHTYRWVRCTILGSLQCGKIPIRTWNLKNDREVLYLSTGKIWYLVFISECYGRHAIVRRGPRPCISMQVILNTFMKTEMWQQKRKREQASLWYYVLTHNITCPCDTEREI